MIQKKRKKGTGIMQLSQRLLAAASMVTAGSRLADIGTDHAYIPIFLAEKDRIPSALAMDINQGPIQRAGENIRRYHLEDRIETRLSDGLRMMKPGEADSILIAGMGGLLIVRILEEGADVAAQARELILQPQSEYRSVRNYLKEKGYRIDAEELILEEEKYYPILHAVPADMQNEENRKESDEEERIKTMIETIWKDSIGEEQIKSLVKELSLCFGPVLLSEKHPVLLGYLKREQDLAEKVLKSMSGICTDSVKKREEEIREQLYLIDLAMRCLAV